HHIDARHDRKSVAFDRMNGVAVAIEQGGGRHDQLQLEVAVLVNGFESGANPGVAGTSGDNDADLSLLQLRESFDVFSREQLVRGDGPRKATPDDVVESIRRQ